MRQNPNLPKHLLVIRLSAMGDVAMTVPVIKALVKKYPNTKISLLTRAHFEPFFDHIPQVQVIVPDLKTKHKGVFGLYRLSNELKALNPDYIIDLHNVLRSKILKLFLISIQAATMDKGRKEKKALVQGHDFHQLKTTHERYADAFRSIGFEFELDSKDIDSDHFTINEDIADILNLRSKLKKIGVAPFAKHPGKMYPKEQMKQVVKELSKTCQIYLFGGPEESIELESWTKIGANIYNIAGNYNIRAEMGIMSAMDIMLCMDSGNAHIAANLGLKVVTIWGVTHPFAGFYPFGQPKEYALLADRNQYPAIPCSVYGNKYPEGYENAAASVSVSQVVEKLQSI